MANVSTRGPVKISQSKYRRRAILLVILLLFVVCISTVFVLISRHTAVPISHSSSFFASIDTMKSSRDTETHPLSRQEITNIVELSASLNTNYITVDTLWDYPDYMQ